MINLYVVVLRHLFLHIFVESNNTFTFAFICFVLCEKSEWSISSNSQFNKNCWMRWMFCKYFAYLFLTSRPFDLLTYSIFDLLTSSFI